MTEEQWREPGSRGRPAESSSRAVCTRPACSTSRIGTPFPESRPPCVAPHDGRSGVRVERAADVFRVVAPGSREAGEGDGGRDPPVREAVRGSGPPGVGVREDHRARAPRAGSSHRNRKQSCPEVPKRHGESPEPMTRRSRSRATVVVTFRSTPSVSSTGRLRRAVPRCAAPGSRRPHPPGWSRPRRIRRRPVSPAPARPSRRRGRRSVRGPSIASFQSAGRGRRGHGCAAGPGGVAARRPGRGAVSPTEPPAPRSPRGERARGGGCRWRRARTCGAA